MKSLAIGIPTHNNFRQLVDTLLTLTLYVEYPYKITVVNNGLEADPKSGVRFEDALREIIPFPDLKVVQAPKNLGWAGGVNLAFRESDPADLFCMANDDLVFIPYHRTFLRQLCSHFRHEETGAVGPGSNFVMGSQSIFDHRGPLVFKTSLLIGFFMVIRSDLFSQIGGLDETLCGGDDFDLSILVRKAGKELLVDRSCHVHHIGQQTGHRVHPGWWDSQGHQEEVTNSIIRKHGFKWWFETMQSKVEIFEPLTQPGDSEGDLIRSWLNGEEKILDVGCGGNKTVPEAVGVDNQPPGSRGTAGGRKHGLPCAADKVAEADDLPFDPGSQDCVIARHVLEHLMNPVKALEEWRRVLKSGGKLIIAVPDSDRVDTFALDWSHVHAFNPDSLKDLIQAAGYNVKRHVRIDPGVSFVMEAVAR